MSMPHAQQILFIDAAVTWIYQPGDVIRATTYSSGYRGT